jgi:hypothetical protein
VIPLARLRQEFNSNIESTFDKDYDKFDNVIGLCPNHHTEYDGGSLYIDFDKTICCHVNPHDESHGKKLVGKIKHIQRGYFEYHRLHVFKG